MMKKIRQLALVACMLPVVLCGNSDPIQTQNASFKEVTSHLDQGGNAYFYFNLKDWVKGLSEKIARFALLNRENLEESPEAEREAEKIELLAYLIQISGLENLNAVGMSSITLSPGLHQNKFVITHGAEKNLGYLWKMFGEKPHALDGLNYLPRQTAMALFSDMDFKVLWAMLEDFAEHAEPGVQKGIRATKEGIAAATGMKLEQILDSFGGQYGVIIMPLEAEQQSQESDHHAHPAQPPVLMFVKVNNDLIFNWIDRMLEEDKSVMRIDNDELKIRKIPGRAGAPTMALAYNGEYLLFATSDVLLEEALAVKAGKKEGLQTTDSFKLLSKGIPKEGIAFSYFNKTLSDPLKSLYDLPDCLSSKLHADYIKHLMRAYQDLLGNVVEEYTVSSMTPEGVVSTALWKTKEFIEK